MLPTYPIEPNVHKIGVLRANAIGDFIFCLPALAALRAAYPHAEIVLLGQKWHVGFLTGRPGAIDRVIAIPPSQGVNEGDGREDPEALAQFFGAIAQENFDIALQLHGGGRYSNPFTLKLGAKLTVGLKTPDAQALDRWVPYIYYQPEILRYLEVVSRVGATPVTLEPSLSITAKDLHEAYQVVPNSDKPLVVLHPGSGAPRRRWAVEKFAAVGDALVDAGAQVMVTGIPAERHLTQAVVNQMRHQAKDLAGCLSLGGMAGLLSRCQVVVSNDSGPLHLAAAVGVATVGIYWCGNSFTAGALSRTRHRPLISWQLTCPICGTDCVYAHCDHQVSFVDPVEVDAVVAAALELLGRQDYSLTASPL